MKLRNEVSENDSWNLVPLYTSQADWEKDFTALEKALATYSALENTLHKDKEHFEKVIRSYLEASRALEKIYTFAHLQSDTDLSHSENLGFVERTRNLYSRFSSAFSFITPEILALSKETLDAYLAAPSLQDLKRMVLDIARYAPHTLSKEEEKLLAQGSEVFGTSASVFSQLNNADLEFGVIGEGDVTETLSHGTYALFLKKQDRSIREKAYTQYLTVFDKHKNTIATTLAGSVKKDIYLAKVKKHSTALGKALFPDEVPQSVYDNLISTVRKNLPVAHRYYALRKKVIGLDTQRMFDTYVPLVKEVHIKTTYDEAVGLLIDSLAPLGSEYLSVLKKGLTEDRWVDRYENKGKRSGAYSGGCYDSAPYILMNYHEENIHDVFTLTHEAGHSMHSYFSRKHQPYQDNDYTIFVAEVASTFNEQLLTHTLREKYKNDKAMLAFLINQQIDDIKGTLIRQTMFAEFEKEIHERGERNEPLTIDAFRKIYRGLLEAYFGPSLSIESLDELECLRIPHFYSAFYVYKYATGISAAIALSDMVLSGDTKTTENYLTFLKSGGSKPPLELLKLAGVNLESPAPVEKAFVLFDRLVRELEELLA